MISMPEKTKQDNLARRLREMGVRLTPQRLAIYEALVERSDHPTAQQLHTDLTAALPSLSPATVYNTLELLLEHGLIHALGDAGDGTVHYDADLEPHINLVCTRCHRIEDFHSEALAAIDESVGARSGYRLQGARLVYYGLCPVCQAEVDQDKEESHG
jgi:Fur family transcriptional regulator, peroxide stress response regulator